MTEKLSVENTCFSPPEYVEEILEKRYFQPGEDWEGLCRRVASTLALVETSPALQKAWEDTFYEELVQGRILPNTPALVNLGAQQIGCAAACFALRPEDSMLSILDTGRLASMILKYGGGVGFELSALRPAGSPVQTTHKYAMGPVGVMKYYNAVGNLVTQAGIRKAALIAILRIDHPDVFRFISAKEEDGELSNFNISVSVSDSFMKKLSTGPDKPYIASFNGKQYHLLPDGTSVLKTERGAQEVLSVIAVWMRICENAAHNGDPGILFVDTVNRDNVLIDGVNDTNNPYYIHGTNPCLAGDQKVCVAGRGPVDIKTLAKEGNDVLILSATKDGEPVFRMMRNPRLTGRNQRILKVLMTDGSSIRCNENHRIYLTDGDDLPAKDLVPGTRLRHITRKEEVDYGQKSSYAMISATNYGRTAEHRILSEYYSGRKLTPEEVIHHIDHNRLNNDPRNLQIMTKKEHDYLHAEDKRGNKNPMCRFPEKNWLTKQDWSGSKNGRYKNVSNGDYFEAAVQVCRDTGRLLTRREWQQFCKENSLPVASKFRLKALNFNLDSELLLAAAQKAGVFSNSEKIKSYRLYLKLKDSYDLPVEFDESRGVIVTKTCEYCGGQFKKPWGMREIGFCSLSCSHKACEALSSEQQRIRSEPKQEETRQKQIAIYYDLRNELLRDPQKSEWEERCKEESVPHRLRGNKDCNQYCFKNFAEIKEAAKDYMNFTVFSVEEDGFEDVYNGTVDETHHLPVVIGEGEYTPGLNKLKILDTCQCGELPLDAKNACILASVDVAKYVTPDGKLDVVKLHRAFAVTTRMLDNMIDASPWPDPEIEEKVKSIRRIGVGVMGYASLLDLLGIKYGSEDAIQTANMIATIRETACSETSKALGEEKGIYPAAKPNEVHRNAARSTIAPTGSLAMIANTSWSIEPHMYWAFLERRNDTTRVRFLPAVEKAIPEDELLELSNQARDLEHLNELIQKRLPKHMVLGHDVPWEKQLLTNAAWQKHTDNAISKTINLPHEELTPEKVSEIYKRAWEEKLKGITVYPFGSRSGEPMSIGSRKKPVEVKLPDELPCTQHKYEVVLDGKIVKAYCFVCHHPDTGRPVATFLKHQHINDLTVIQFVDLTTRLLSLALRYRYCMHCGEESIPIGELIKQLRETDGQSMRGIPSIFINALSKYLSPGDSVGYCPSCRQPITIIEGCESCRSCGWRACS